MALYKFPLVSLALAAVMFVLMSVCVATSNAAELQCGSVFVARNTLNATESKVRSFSDPSMWCQQIVAQNVTSIANAAPGACSTVIVAEACPRYVQVPR